MTPVPTPLATPEPTKSPTPVPTPTETPSPTKVPIPTATMVPEQAPDPKNKSKDCVLTGLYKIFKNCSQQIKKVYGSNFKTVCLDRQCRYKENINGNGMCYVYNYRNGTNVCSNGNSVWWPCPDKFCSEIDKINGRPVYVRI